MTLRFLGMHEAFFRSRAAQTVRDPQTHIEFEFRADELVQIETSNKVAFTINSWLTSADWCSTPEPTHIVFSRRLTCAH